MGNPRRHIAFVPAAGPREDWNAKALKQGETGRNVGISATDCSVLHDAGPGYSLSYYALDLQHAEFHIDTRSTEHMFSSIISTAKILSKRVQTATG